MPSILSPSNNCLANPELLRDVATEFGTPLYVYSQKIILENYKRYQSALGENSGQICYAVKANDNLAVLSILKKAGSGFDIVSEGELERVLRVDVDLSKCVYSGVYKPKSALIKALKRGIGCINIESHQEFIALSALAERLDVVIPISIRLNPAIDPQTHPYIATGMAESKFGINIDLARKLYNEAHQSKNLHPKGIGFHLGSQLATPTPYLDALPILISLLSELNGKGMNISQVNLGGGLGVTPENNLAFDPREYLEEAKRLAAGCHLIVEPGRSIVANAGVLLVEVKYLKQTHKTSFAIVDGAMNDFLRPALYQAEHQIVSLAPANNGLLANWKVVGPVCESGDFLGTTQKIRIKPGDILSLSGVGAYGAVMSSNYNARPRAAILMIEEDGGRKIIKTRENFDDLMRGERVL